MKSKAPDLLRFSRWLGVFVSPIGVYTLYMLIAHWANDCSTTLSDRLFFVGSITLGVVSIVAIPIERGSKIVFICVYVPTAGLLLFAYVAYFSFSVFNDWI